VRYLHGDSTEFKEQYNFLQTLQGFVACAGRVALLSSEIRTLEAELVEHMNQRADVLDQVTRFCGALIQHIGDKAREGSPPDPIGSIATQQVEMLSATLEQARANMARDAQQAKTRTASEVEKRRAAIHGSIGEFLTREILPVLSTSFSMRLTGTGATLTATFEHRGGISACFDLDAGSASSLVSAQKVSALVPEMSLQVGMKKKFLSKDMAPEVLVIDDYVLTAIDLAEGSCDIRLKRKADAPKDALTIEMREADGRLAARITRTESDEPTYTAEPVDHPKLQALWRAVAERVTPVLARKQRLCWVRLDGNDVFSNDLVLELIDRFVDQFAPVVASIAQHSPSPDELSLKMERGDGRREEIYVRKVDLAKHFAALPPDSLERFTILAIFPEGQAVELSDDDIVTE